MNLFVACASFLWVVVIATLSIKHRNENSRKDTCRDFYIFGLIILVWQVLILLWSFEQIVIFYKTQVVQLKITMEFIIFTSSGMCILLNCFQLLQFGLEYENSCSDWSFWHIVFTTFCILGFVVLGLIYSIRKKCQVVSDIEQAFNR
jgi:hypothetical protein